MLLVSCRIWATATTRARPAACDGAVIEDGSEPLQKPAKIIVSRVNAEVKVGLGDVQNRRGDAIAPPPSP